ncbi:hypothetical protein [Halomonas alimentaria]|uniref:hypothetical protein n=1 Tax=Halomonas alimentaria TaxID=147248 RepID=UPI0024914EC9|nr:hypothetical protein [Halomonas alimentaria]
MPNFAQHALQFDFIHAEHQQDVALGGVEGVLALLLAGQALNDGHGAHERGESDTGLIDDNLTGSLERDLLETAA